MKKLLTILLVCTFFLCAINFVSAGNVDYAVEVNTVNENIKDISITEQENTVLKDGGCIKKKMTITKHFKTYKKAKKLSFKSSQDNKKVIKKQIKKAVKKGGDNLGCQFYSNIKQSKKLKDCKIVKTIFKPFYKNVEFADYNIYKVKFYKVIVKYKPFKKVVAKSKKVTAKIYAQKRNYEYLGLKILYPYLNVEFKNPFTNKLDWRSAGVCRY